MWTGIGIQALQQLTGIVSPNERSAPNSELSLIVRSTLAELHLLLRNSILQELWHQQPLHHHHRHQVSLFSRRSRLALELTSSLFPSVVNVGMTVPGIWGVDHFGRRGMLLLGAAGMGISQIIVAAVGVAIDDDNLAGQRVLIAFVCFFIAFFAATWGPLAWVVTGEIYPTSIRAKAMSMSTASNWL